MKVQDELETPFTDNQTEETDTINEPANRFETVSYNSEDDTGFVPQKP